MTEQLDLYKAIAQREKNARREAERLLEEKSRELFAQNQALERAAARLKKTAGLLSEIMRVAPDGVFKLTTSFEFERCNAEARRQLGAQSEQIIGAHVEKFFPGITAHMTDGIDGYFRIDKLDVGTVTGDSFPAEIRGFHGMIGSEEAYVLFVHDITNRVEADDKRIRIEQQLDEARRLEAIGTISAGIAHEINTPIQFIGDNLAFLRNALKDIHSSWRVYEELRCAAIADGAYPDLVERINAVNESIDLEPLTREIFSCLKESEEGTTQVRDIVRLMKEFSHPGSDESNLVDLNQMIGNALKISKRNIEEGVEIRLELDPDMPKVNVRQSQLQQVVLNLVINAMDAIYDRGEPGGVIRLATAYTDSNAIIKISDNGGGVPDSLRQKIFDPFFTTKPVGKGTGQGLALAKDIVVKGHGGRLTLIDEPPFDTTFFIELPRSLAAIGEGEADNVDAA